MSAVVAINGRFLTQPITGVQRYATELLGAMDALLDDARFCGMQFECLLPPETSVLPRWNRIRARKVGRLRGNTWEQFELPFWSRGSLLFSPANIGPVLHSRQVLTLHDASVFAIPQAYSKAFRLKYRYVFKSLAPRAPLIFTDSRFSQRELAHYLIQPTEKFKVIPLGSDHILKIQSDLQILEHTGLKKGQYLLTVASNSLHKNFGQIINVARRMKDVLFVAVGGSFSTVFQGTGYTSPPPNVHLLGYVNDAQLKTLYENALGFILPSLYEGFGLPVLEAMRCGCPVISSNAASLPEVAGDAALYFDPTNQNKIEEVLNHFLKNSDSQERLRLLGYQQATRFTWEKTACNVLESLLEISS